MFTNRLFASSKAVIGLDVGSYAVKAVALQSNRDRITLQGYAQARIDNQDIGEVIRRVLSQLGVRSKRVVTAVSGRSVIVRQVETPKLEDAALKQHIAYEADKYIPFGTEEVILDCQPLPGPASGGENTQQVMLVAVRKNFVQEHLSSLKAAGVSAEIIDVDVFALANAYELLGPPVPSQADRKAVAVIDIGATKTNIAILHAERLLFTREIYLAGNEISDAIARTLNYQPEEVEAMKLAPGEALESILDAAMPAFEDLANEIRLSFDYVEGQFDTEVSTVVLSGGTSQLANVSGILGNILGRPVYVFDPLAGLDLVPSKYDIHGLDANSPGLTVALGLAAHILGHEQRSLGGQQSHEWKPRSKALDLVPSEMGGEGIVDDGGGVPFEEDQPAVAYEQEQEQDLGETRPTGPYNTQSQGYAGFSQSAAVDLVATHTPASGRSTVETTYGESVDVVGDLDNTFFSKSEPQADGLDPVLTTDDPRNRSGMLVVLEDDDQIPSERHERQSPTIQRHPSTTVRVLDFAEEDDSAQSPGSGSVTTLPPLPPLPGKQS